MENTIKEGDKVIYQKTLKALDFGTVGIAGLIYPPNRNNKEEWTTVIYEQNRGTNQVFSHSACTKDLKRVDNPND